MTQQEQNNVIRMGTASFMRNLCRTLNDMVNAEFHIGVRNPDPITGFFKQGFTVVSHFSGKIQGEFILSTDEPTAAKIAGVAPPDAPPPVITERRETYSSCLCEAMNTSAHLCLDDLRRFFGTLTLLPPAWVYGEYHTVDFVSGIGYLRGASGMLQCSLVLNLAGLESFDSAKHRYRHS